MIEFKGSKWYKCDLHLHTTASECFADREVTPEQWVDRAIEQGLHCVAVTDHNTLLGIIAPIEPKDKGNKPKNPTPTGSEQPNKYKYNILKVIEKRNQEEEAIDELIAEFEKKISSFFYFIKTDDNGQRLIAKIKDEGSAFSQDEIYLDFTKLYRKYTIKNKDLGDFFIRETKDILNQLCDDFERSLNQSPL